MGENWADGPMVGLDTETTGVDVFNDRIVTATLSWYTPGQAFESRSWVADPGIEIPEGAARVHGYSTERARAEGEPERDVVEQVIEMADRLCVERSVPLVIYNAGYDLSILHARALDHALTGWPTEGHLPGPILDPLAMDRGLHPRVRRKRKLEVVAGAMRLAFDASAAHASDYDTLVAMRLAYRFAKVYPDKVGEVDLGQLQHDQALWHYQWAEGFERWLRSKGSADVIEREWPIRYRPAEAVAEVSP